jgi:23S rRNA pseudouridine1911/1915/1917 synthase
LSDQTYGGRRKASARIATADQVNLFPRQALHAAELGFDHPVSGAALHFTAPLPDDMATLLDGLREKA